MEIDHSKLSKRELLKLKPLAERKAFWDSLSEMEKAELAVSLQFNGRPDQQPPKKNERYTAIICGRGWGKSFTAAQMVNYWARKYPKCHIGVVSAIFSENDRILIHGESGILAWASPSFMPKINLSKLELTYPNNSRVSCYTGEKAGADLRGPNHQFMVIDEIAKYPHAKEVYDQAKMTLRSGSFQQMMLLTTPKNTKFMRDLIADPNVHVRNGSTYENTTLSKEFLRDMKESYGSTRLGRQEIDGEMLPADSDTQLFSMDVINETRILPEEFDINEMEKVVVAVDPTIANKTGRKDGDECGIMVGGVSNKRGYLIDDLSKRCSPAEWVKISVQAYHRYNAQEIYLESNAAGESALRALYKDYDPSVKLIFHRSNDSKGVRAAPVSQLSASHKLHMVGQFDELEGQLVEFDVSGNPRSYLDDRFDAYVMLNTRLLVRPTTVSIIY